MGSLRLASPDLSHRTIGDCWSTGRIHHYEWTTIEINNQAGFARCSKEQRGRNTLDLFLNRFKGSMDIRQPHRDRRSVQQLFTLHLNI